MATTLKDVLQKLNECDSEDYKVEHKSENYIVVTFIDFIEFDAYDGEDLWRELNNWEAIDSFMWLLHKTCKKWEDHRIEYFYYDDFTVETCWTSDVNM